jgi:uncharacterized membrane protein
MKQIFSPSSGDDDRLKISQRRNFMEKKIKRTSQDTESASYSSEEKTIILTILVALAVMVAILVYIAFFTPTQKEPFTSLYLLDSEKQLENIPETVVLGENSTFTLWVGVENRNDTTIEYSVQVSLDDGNSSAELIECLNRTLANGETWEFPVEISIDQPGSNKITFELWYFNEAENGWDQTEICIDLSIEAIEA